MSAKSCEARIARGAGWWSRGEAPPSGQILVGHQGLTLGRAAISRQGVTVVRNKISAECLGWASVRRSSAASFGLPRALQLRGGGKPDA